MFSTHMESVEGGYGATVGETRSEEPGVLIVPGARLYDLVSGLRTPIRARSFIAASSEAGQMAASDYVPCRSSSKNRLHLAGRPQMSTRPSSGGRSATANAR